MLSRRCNLFLLVIAFTLCNCDWRDRDRFFACNGKTGFGADLRDSVEESPALQISGDSIQIQDSLGFVGVYQICEKNDLLLFFTTADNRAVCGNNDGHSKTGALNRVTGRMTLRRADIYGNYRCKEGAPRL